MFAIVKLVMIQVFNRLKMLIMLKDYERLLVITLMYWLSVVLPSLQHYLNLMIRLISCKLFHCIKSYWVPCLS